jgi:CheY-like chemotaxis protein
MRISQPIRILLIDAAAADSTILVDLLTPRGHTVIAASSGTDGLLKAQPRLPDLIPLDIMMPGMDGF